MEDSEAFSLLAPPSFPLPTLSHSEGGRNTSHLHLNHPHSSYPNQDSADTSDYEEHCLNCGMVMRDPIEG